MMPTLLQRGRRRQRGYTLVEIVIALLIGLFLLAGLFTIFSNTRRTSSQQSGLAQLQDEERIAMSLLNDVVQNAGYYNTNLYQSAQTAWPAAVADAVSATTLAPGQAISGTHTSSTAPDILVARYATTGTDNVINCTGSTSTTPQNYVNTFYVLPNTPGNTNYALYCTYDGTTNNAVPLVIGVENMQVWYGISTAAGTNNVDTYKTADLMTAANWANVTSVRVTLTFVNPMYSTATAAQEPQFVYFTRVIALQGRTGVVATAL
jgi:type IV pilus assembly protein PilW